MVISNILHWYQAVDKSYTFLVIIGTLDTEIKMRHKWTKFKLK